MIQPQPPHSDRASIAGDARALGVREGMVLLVHSSLRSIGWVEGGERAVIEGLEDALGERGTLVLPTLSYEQIRTENPRFDVRHTPSCVGRITEVFRHLPGVVRSRHPTHSLAARGPRAAELMAGHERCHSPGPIGSPYHKIVEAGGFILFLGTGLACNTMLHAVEEWAQVPQCLHDVPQPLEVVDYDGRVIPCPQYRHKGGHSRFYAKMEPLFRRQGFMAEGLIGRARCHLIDARAMNQYLQPLLRRWPDLFTHNDLDPALLGE